MKKLLLISAMVVSLHYCSHLTSAAGPPEREDGTSEQEEALKGQELQRIHRELSLLRADVRQLIDLLEQQQRQQAIDSEQVREGEALQPHLNGGLSPQTSEERRALLRTDAPSRPGNQDLPQLHKTVRVQFTEASLSQVLDSLQKMASVRIVLDEQALAVEGVTRETKINFRLTEPISLQSVLRLILDPLQLTYVIRDDEIIITAREARDAIRYVRTYNIAGLIAFAAHPVVTWSRASATNKAAGHERRLFDEAVGRLVEQIKSIAPETWNENGGGGTIRAFHTNLSLVISQTGNVHRRIGDFLSQLRRQQNPRITLRAWLIHIPEDGPTDLASELLVDPKAGLGLLLPSQTSAVLEYAQKNPRASLLQMPNISVFNGQTARFWESLPGKEDPIELLIKASLQPDEGHALLSFEFSPADETKPGDSQRSSVSLDLKQTILVDLSSMGAAKSEPSKDFLLISVLEVSDQDSGMGATSANHSPPSDKEVLRQLGLEGAASISNVRIVKEKIAEYVDPPRLMPLVGKAQLVHSHYKCTVNMDSTAAPQVVYVEQQALLMGDTLMPISVGRSGER